MVKNYVLLIFLVVNILGCAGFKKWDRTDQILFGTFTALNTVDIFQTREIKLDGNGYSELSPCLDGLSRDQATAVKVGFNVVAYYGLDRYPRYRTAVLVALNLVVGACVINNHSIGVRVSF